MFFVRQILLGLVLLFCALPAQAQETAPGDACIAVEQGFFRRAAAGNAPVDGLNFLYCDGANWLGFLKYDESTSVVFLPAPATEPADGEIANSNWTIWLDEPNSEFELKGKKADGTVVSATVGGKWRDGAGANEIQFSSANVGINTTDPRTWLDVAGAIQIGDDGEACAVAADIGRMRFDGSEFEICQDPVDGWEPLEGAGGTGVCNSTQTFSTPGSHNYTVPAAFETITIKVWGGGGGGGGSSTSAIGANGGAGGASSVVSLGLSASGGAGGVGAGNLNPAAGGGVGGSASGGDVNTGGANGANGVFNTISGAGGSAPSGGIGGAGVGLNVYGIDGGTPGGGGSGGMAADGNSSGGGGSGGYTEKNYTTATLIPGANITDIIVGDRGSYGNSTRNGGFGGYGQVSITCTDAGGAGPGTTLGGTDDVDLTGLSNDSIIVYDGASSEWVDSATDTGSILLPRGTAAQQPSSPIEGMIRFNTDTDVFEGYVDDGSPAWEAINTGAGGMWSAGSGNDIYYNLGTPEVVIGTASPNVALDVVGDIEFTGTITDVSDKRLKTDIQNLSEGQLQNILDRKSVV